MSAHFVSAQNNNKSNNHNFPIMPMGLKETYTASFMSLDTQRGWFQKKMNDLALIKEAKTKSYTGFA